MASNSFFCPDPIASELMMQKISIAKESGDSLGWDSTSSDKKYDEQVLLRKS